MTLIRATPDCRSPSSNLIIFSWMIIIYFKWSWHLSLFMQCNDNDLFILAKDVLTRTLHKAFKGVFIQRAGPWTSGNLWYMWYIVSKHVYKHVNIIFIHVYFYYFIPHFCVHWCNHTWIIYINFRVSVLSAGFPSTDDARCVSYYPCFFFVVFWVCFV